MKRKARESTQKREYYQRKKKERGEPEVYRPPRAQRIYTEPEKHVVFSVGFV